MFLYVGLCAVLGAAFAWILGPVALLFVGFVAVAAGAIVFAD